MNFLMDTVRYLIVLSFSLYCSKNLILFVLNTDSFYVKLLFSIEIKFISF